MIALDALFRLIPNLDAIELEQWIEERWVRPEGLRGAYLFRDVDVARVRLIVEMRQDLAVDDEAMPLILSLLDQVYGLRRQLKALCDAVEAQPEEIRETILGQLAARRRDS